MGHLVDRELAAGSVALSPSGADGDKFTLRGFALRRDVYRAIGGIEAHYGWLSGSLLAARLAAEGPLVAHVPTAVVEFDGAAHARQPFQYIWEYSRELVRYLDEGGDTLRPYLARLVSHAPSPHASRTSLMLRYWLARFRCVFLSFTNEQAQQNWAMAADRLRDWAEAKFHAPAPVAKPATPAPPLEQRRTA
jgi:hypothetical protein